MAIIKASALKTAIARVRKNKEAFRAEVQEVLVSVAYQACLGNANWANEILDAVRDTASIKGITRWLETYAPLVVRKGAFAINKGARKSMGVTDEASFTEYEVEMRKVGWWEMAAPQKATSIFAPDEYIDGAFERMAKKLNDEGQPDLAAAVQSLVSELYSSEAWKKLNAEAKKARDAEAEKARDAEKAERAEAKKARDAEAKKARDAEAKKARDAEKAERAEAKKARDAEKAERAEAKNATVGEDV